MARYIDLDTLSIGLCNEQVFEDRSYAKGWNNAIKLIEQEPTADVVEVVKCKACKWWRTLGCAFRTDCVKGLPCADDFCSHGERRER
jgi:hypothetical protein